jgi:capsular exopolysaccharide synthesis family protein
MSRMYEALKKTERERDQTGMPRAPIITSSVNVRHAPDIRWDFDGFARQEYERIGILMKTPTDGKVMRTLAITGCRSGSGATTTATLMAATLASSKRSRVLLVDANLRTPSLDLVFSTPNTAGFTDVLGEDKSAEACIQPTGQQNLFLLTTGGIPAHPGTLLERATIERFLERVTADYDFVIFDTAPVLQFPATCALASYVDGVLLVLHADRTSVDDARRAKAELERVSACVLGAVLNRREDYTPSLLRRFATQS